MVNELLSVIALCAGKRHQSLPGTAGAKDATSQKRSQPHRGSREGNAEKVQGGGKGSVRHITRGAEDHLVSIRTSQDQWFAFPLTPENTWLTLEQVDVVIVASVDDRDAPKNVNVHWSAHP
jgi:hypothetical protein